MESAGGHYTHQADLPDNEAWPFLSALSTVQLSEGEVGAGVGASLAWVCSFGSSCGLLQFLG